MEFTVSVAICKLSLYGLMAGSGIMAYFNLSFICYFWAGVALFILSINWSVGKVVYVVSRPLSVSNVAQDFGVERLTHHVAIGINRKLYSYSREGLDWNGSWRKYAQITFVGFCPKYLEEIEQRFWQDSLGKFTNENYNVLEQNCVHFVRHVLIGLRLDCPEHVNQIHAAVTALHNTAAGAGFAGISAFLMGFFASCASGSSP